MKLSKVKIHNYRPFSDISLDLFPYTVIIGENNVGKSNVLRALELFFRPSQALVRRAMMRSRPGAGVYYRTLLQKVRTAQSNEFDYERDFPVVSQSGGGKRQTKIRVTFSPESSDFIRLKLDKKFEKRRKFSITQQIKIQRDHPTDMGYVSSTLSAGELEEFLTWLFQTVDYVRIPSTRGSAASQRLLRAFLVRIHDKMRASYKVKKYLEGVVDRAKKEVDKAEREIQSGLRQFLQSLQSVELELGDVPDLSELLTIETVKLNDGTATQLESKGDGVQSLFFMGLAQYLATLKVNRYTAPH